MDTFCIWLILTLSICQQICAEDINLPNHPVYKRNSNSLPPPNGIYTTIGQNLTIYESRGNSTSSPVMLIAVYDLFGLHPQVQYISDKLANRGFRVIIPDFYRGKAYDVNNWPPPNFKSSDLNYIFTKNGFWNDKIRDDVIDLISFYKKQGVKSFGMFGFCWGGKISVFAANDPTLLDIKAIGLVHPSKVTTEDADNSHAPMILLPSKDEPNMIPFLNKLKSKLGNTSEHKRFKSMGHGFAGARSDIGNSTIKARVDEVITKMGNFFQKRLVS